MINTHAEAISALNGICADLTKLECKIDNGLITAMRNELEGAIKYFDEPAVWHYYVNDEGKPRWKCSNCGKIARRRPDDKRYCSICSKPMVFES